MTLGPFDKISGFEESYKTFNNASVTIDKTFNNDDSVTIDSFLFQLQF